MEALNAKLSALEAKQMELEDKKRQLEDEECALIQEKHQLEQERLKLSKVLLPAEKEQLKQELIAVGELLELPSVILGSLHVVSENPTWDGQLYSIDIDTSLSFDSGVSGLRVDVLVKTKQPAVEDVVKSLFEQEGYGLSKEPPDLCWQIHWDYYRRIKLKERKA